MNGIGAMKLLLEGKKVSREEKTYCIRGTFMCVMRDVWTCMDNEDIINFLNSDGFELYNEKLVSTIEVGKFYLTREGKKAIIYAVGCGKHGAIHGAIYDADGYCEVYEWSYDGGVCLPEESYTDIIGFWDGE